MSIARLPLEKFLEQPVALFGRKRGRLLAAPGKELVELLALGLWRCVPAQPFLGALEALPARQHGGKVCFLPFRMARRFLEFGNGFVDFARLEIELAQLEANLEIGREALGSLLALGQLIRLLSISLSII